MKIAMLALMAITTVLLAQTVVAENTESVMPPPGPYRSIGDVDQYKNPQDIQNNRQSNEEQRYSFTQPNQKNTGVQEWRRSRQQRQMGNWMNQGNFPQGQYRNTQPQMWDYNRYPPMQNNYPGQMPGYQNNRMAQPFPPARGPVYGPSMPPAEFYNQQAQPMQQY